MRAAADLEMQQVVNEVRRQVEKEKEIAIAETKRKKWVRHLHTIQGFDTGFFVMGEGNRDGCGSYMLILIIF